MGIVSGHYYDMLSYTILVNFKFPLLTHTRTAHALLVPTYFLASGAMTWYVFLTLLLLVTSSQAQRSARVRPARGAFDKLLFCVSHLVSLLRMP